MDTSGLPDFHIPHAEKIEWMIETNGWAIEPVPACADTEPPSPSYAYTIGVTALTGFPEIAVFGLTPVAANGLAGLVIDALRSGTEIPTGVELVGLLDNDLRCVFAPVDLAVHGQLVRHGDCVVRRPAVHHGPAAVSRSKRLHAVRARVRAAPAARPAGGRHARLVTGAVRDSARMPSATRADRYRRDR